MKRKAERKQRKALVVTHRTAGLAEDASVLQLAMEACGRNVSVMMSTEIVLRSAPAAELRRQVSDVGTLIFLEHVYDAVVRAFPSARVVLVPNPEWLGAQDTAVPDEVWHKTRVSHALLSAVWPDALHARIGWTSRDCGPGDAKPQALHIKGCSEQKQTGAVLQAWARHPEWPVLHVVSYLDHPAFLDVPFPLTHGNVVVHSRRLPRQELQELMRSCELHVCPSDAEGFGHSINEARSVGAVIVTTDAAPMNELVQDGETGYLVPVARREPHRFSRTPGLSRAVVAVEDLERTVERALAGRGTGAAARARYERERAAFFKAVARRK